MKNKDSIAAALRALGHSKTDVSFQLANDGDAKFLAKSVVLPEFEDLAQMRSVADSAAARLRYHNVATHNMHRPSGESAGIFDALESARGEALLARRFAGVFENINSLKSFDESIPQQLTKLFWERSLGLDVAQQSALGQWVLGHASHQFDRLQTSVENQEEFARAANDLIRVLETGQEASEQQDSSDENSEPENNKKENQEPDEDQDSQENKGDQRSEGASEQSASGDPQEMKGKKMEAGPNPGLLPNEAGAAEFHYKIYSRQFDQVVHAHQLANFVELGRLRVQLDQKMAGLKTITGKLAARLQKLLLAQRQSWWEFDKEEGNVDANRLARFIAAPEYQNIYKIYRENDFKDTIVTLLIDNSGSMRGRPIVSAMACADILAKTLEQCGVRVEILGFTTAEWKGGKARAAWQKAGGPKNPGRLNDLLHIIYKSADEPWRRAKRNLSLALKDGILKENIDGEAILWAYSRLFSRPESRKILMVISDGAPVDDSTISTNNTNYLDLHLRQVVKKVESFSDVELLAIGIGHDVGRYYKNAVTIMDISDLGETMIGKMEELFGRAAA